MFPLPTLLIWNYEHHRTLLISSLLHTFSSARYEQMSYWNQIFSLPFLKNNICFSFQHIQPLHANFLFSQQRFSLTTFLLHNTFISTNSFSIVYSHKMSLPSLTERACDESGIHLAQSNYYCASRIACGRHVVANRPAKPRKASVAAFITLPDNLEFSYITSISQTQIEAQNISYNKPSDLSKTSVITPTIFPSSGLFFYQSQGKETRKRMNLHLSPTTKKLDSRTESKKISKSSTWQLQSHAPLNVCKNLNTNSCQGRKHSLCPFKSFSGNQNKLFLALLRQDTGKQLSLPSDTFHV